MSLLLVIAAVVILVFFVKFLMKKKEAQEREKAEILRKQEEAQILRKQQEEEQWQEDIRTGKVNFSAAIGFFSIGTMLMETEKYDEAIEQFTKAIDSNPRFIEAYCNRGIAYKRKGDYDRAIADYHQGWSLDSEDVDILYNLGLAHMDKKEFLVATVWFGQMERCSEFKSLDKEQKVMRLLDAGIASFNSGIEENFSNCFSDACRKFNAALKIDPNNSDAIRLFEMAQQRLPYTYDRRI